MTLLFHSSINNFPAKTLGKLSHHFYHFRCVPICSKVCDIFMGRIATWPQKWHFNTLRWWWWPFNGTIKSLEFDASFPFATRWLNHIWQLHHISDRKGHRATEIKPFKWKYFRLTEVFACWRHIKKNVPPPPSVDNSLKIARHSLQLLSLYKN